MQEAEYLYFARRLEFQALGNSERDTWSRPLLLFKKVCGLSQLVCFAWETSFWCTCTICLAGVFGDGSEVCSSYQKGSGHSFAFRLTSFPNTCLSTCLVMSFAVQLVSDFVRVFTFYVLRQRHGFKLTPPQVTCVMLMISKMSSMHVLFHCANFHMISLRRKYAPLFPQQFFVHELNAVARFDWRPFLVNL
jgi:hypothetical protein